MQIDISRGMADPLCPPMAYEGSRLCHQVNDAEGETEEAPAEGDNLVL
jgi:hypothetical protein